LEFCFGVILYSELGNENSDAGHIAVLIIFVAESKSIV